MTLDSRAWLITGDGADAVAGPDPARGHIGIESVDRTSGVPGDWVDVLIDC